MREPVPLNRIGFFIPLTCAPSPGLALLRKNNLPEQIAPANPLKCGNALLVKQGRCCPPPCIKKDPEGPFLFCSSFTFRFTRTGKG